MAEMAFEIEGFPETKGIYLVRDEICLENYYLILLKIFQVKQEESNKILKDYVIQPLNLMHSSLYNNFIVTKVSLIN